MTMPRLSLYRPEKGNDFRFIDKSAWEMFQVGGTDVLVHRYIGPGSAIQGDTPSTPSYTGDNVANIQDLLFLENRDRKYDPDVYVMRGVYNISDIDFNLSQFGLFLQNDTIFITFHITDTVEKLGRKIIAGDVIELPHLKDEYALNDLTFALKRFFVIEEVSRAAEGFSATWYPHLYRAKCKPLVDSQEFKQILDDIADREFYKGTYNSTVTYYPGDVVLAANGKKYQVIQEVTGVAPPNTTYFALADTLRDVISTYEKEMQITAAVLNQAEADAPRSGYDTSKYYTLQRTADGDVELASTDATDVTVDAATQSTDINGILQYEETANLWSSSTSYNLNDTFVYSTISAGSFKVDRSYTIISLGNTNWNTVANTNSIVYSVGDTLIAKVVGSGSGVAHEIYNDEATLYTVIKIGETPQPPNSEYYRNDGPATKEFVGQTASSVILTSDGDGYDGYLTEDGMPPNGAPFTAGISFPNNPINGQFALRTDYLPNRLFRFDGARWRKFEDNVRMTMSNLGASDVAAGTFAGKDVRQTQKATFINNPTVSTIDGHTVKEKQSLSKALRPEADL